MELNENPNSYFLIPASVALNADLTPNARILYGLIKLLSHKEKYCFATNAYLARQFKKSNNKKISPKTVSNWIAELTKAGYLTTVEERINDAKTTTQRRLYICDPLRENMVTPPQKKGDPLHENVVTPLHENVEHNNKSINNIIDNNNIISTSEASSPTKTTNFKKPTIEEIKEYVTVQPIF